MIASVWPGFGSGLSVAVNPGCADVLTSARMGPLYTTGSISPTLSRLRENYFGMLEFQWSACVAHQEHTPAGCSKRPDFSPAQPWRLLHPPALSLPRQPLCPETRLIPSKAAANVLRRFFQACSCTLPRMTRMSPPLRATFSPAHPLARRDVPVARARAFGGRALREHRRSSGSIPSSIPALPFLSSRVAWIGPNVRASNEALPFFSTSP